jgi:hypothetical protein
MRGKSPADYQEKGACRRHAVQPPDGICGTGRELALKIESTAKNTRLRDIKSGAKPPITPARIDVHQMEAPPGLLSQAGNIVPDDAETPDYHLHIMAGKPSGEVTGCPATIFLSLNIPG